MDNKNSRLPFILLGIVAGIFTGKIIIKAMTSSLSTPIKSLILISFLLVLGSIMITRLRYRKLQQIELKILENEIKNFNKK